MTETTALVPFEEVRQQLTSLKTEFAAMLPSHIAPEKYQHVVLTALERDPNLLLADRASLMIACKEAANDGLLPDKKEGALVIYKTKVKVPGEQNPRTPNIKPLDRDVWIDMVKWMPMVFGIRKKMFQTGKVKDMQVELVYEKDFYERAAGDDAQIIHRPLDFGDRGKILGGYAIIATLPVGVYREVMSLAQIEAVAKAAKTQTVWGGDFRTEMMRKTILRRLSKQVPLSAEVERVLSRDDHMWDFDATRGTPAALLAGGERHRAMRAIPSSELFEDKAVKEAKAADQTPATEPVQDAEITDHNHSAEVVAIVTAVRQVSTPQALLELIDSLPDNGDEAFTAEENDWIDETMIERCEAMGVELLADLTIYDALAKHMGIELVTEDAGTEASQQSVDASAQGQSEGVDAGEPGESEETPAEDESQDRPPLGATITSAMGFQRYSDPDLWASDILNKLSVLTVPAQAQAFWKTNAPFILKARDDGYAVQADKILKVASDRGLYRAN